MTVSNRGGVAYEPWMNGQFELDNGDYIQSLNETIQPGEKIVFEFSDYLFVDKNGSVNSNVELILEEDDDFTTNNKDFILLVNSLYESHELELYSASISAANCFDEIRTLDCRVENNSCSVLPCLLYTSPSPRDQRGSRMPSSA